MDTEEYTDSLYELCYDGPLCPILDDEGECENRDYPDDWAKCADCGRKCCPDHMEVVGEERYCADDAEAARAYVAAHSEENAK